MKKRNFLIIIAIVGILFINIIDANALQANNSDGGSNGSGITTCVYVWEQNAFFGDEKDSQGLAVPVDTTFALQTKTGSDRLTVIKSKEGNIKGEFDNKNGIPLDDGECPSISIYSKPLGGVKVYANRAMCTEELFNIDSRCSPLLYSTEKSDQSASNITNNSGTGGQFSLVERETNSCRYRTVLDNENDEPQYTDITITPSGSDNVKGTCATNRIGITTCEVKKIDISEHFYLDGSFYCPNFIYTDEEITSISSGDTVIITNQISTFTITNTGGSSDEDKSYHSPSNPDGTSIPDGMTGNADPLDPIEIDQGVIECPDIFDTETEGALGWLLITILNYIKVIGPILVVLLSATDFVKAVFSSDDKSIKEAQSKLIIRLIAAVALFLVPTLIQVLLSFINQTTCMI